MTIAQDGMLLWLLLHCRLATSALSSRNSEEKRDPPLLNGTASLDSLPRYMTSTRRRFSLFGNYTLMHYRNIELYKTSQYTSATTGGSTVVITVFCAAPVGIAAAAFPDTD